MLEGAIVSSIAPWSKNTLMNYDVILIYIKYILFFAFAGMLIELLFEIKSSWVQIAFIFVGSLLASIKTSKNKRS
jgi:hypothetical protein